MNRYRSERFVLRSSGGGNEAVEGRRTRTYFTIRWICDVKLFNFVRVFRIQRNLIGIVIRRLTEEAIPKFCDWQLKESNKYF